MLRRKHPDKQVQLWAQDEARLGLQPILRRIWAPVGKQPYCDHKRGYQWVYLYHFLRPSTGDSHCLIMPTVNNEAMSLALENWIQDLPQAEDKILVLLVDQAGWHMSKKLRVPENVVLYPLPPYTPELQPVEASWPLFREPLANRFFAQLDDLVVCLIHRCRWLADHPELLRARCAWQWLIHAENPA